MVMITLVMMITIMVRRGGMVVMDTVRPSIRAS